MTILAYLVLGIYILALSYIAIFCFLQLHLLIKYREGKRQNNGWVDPVPEDYAWPVVTIQLPIFNELYVTERLIDRIVQLDYPKDKLEIQILDDSNDETLEITKQKVVEYSNQGFDIKAVIRNNRKGYKAGALKEGLKSAKGEFIAIFDADFMPRRDFLRRIIPQFKDEKIGVVQTRWEHINEHYSLITRLQAFQLNVHFTVEQEGRYLSNYLLQFNGTAGIWRAETIADAGGWEADTLTEDLDLSYRAQLKGWKIKYMSEIGSPAELPSEIGGLKSQQYRWMKGGAETSKKLLKKVWNSNLSLEKKIHASSHLSASIIFIFVFVVGVFSVPVMFAIHFLSINTMLLSIFFLSLLSIIFVYYEANVRQEYSGGSYVKRFLKFILLFPLFLSLSMGLSLHNTVAIIQGLRGKKTPFVRTPKFDIKGISDTFEKKIYFNSGINWITFFEGVLAIYFMMAVIYELYNAQSSFLIYHLLLMFGFASIFYYSIRHHIGAKQ